MKLASNVKAAIVGGVLLSLKVNGSQYLFDAHDVVFEKRKRT